MVNWNASIIGGVIIAILSLGFTTSSGIFYLLGPLVGGMTIPYLVKNEPIEGILNGFVGGIIGGFLYLLAIFLVLGTLTAFISVLLAQFSISLGGLSSFIGIVIGIIIAIVILVISSVLGALGGYLGEKLIEHNY